MLSRLSQSLNQRTKSHPRLVARRSLQGLLLIGLGCLSACAISDAQSTTQSPRFKGDRQAVPVVMATADRQTVPQLFRTTGTVQAYSTVSVQAQVAGQIMGVYFREGQAVQAGDLLFKLDSRELQAALDQAIANRAKALAGVTQAQASVAQAESQVKQAKATVAKEAAQASNADLQAQRYDSLLAQGAVSREQVDQFRTNAELDFIHLGSRKGSKIRKALIDFS